MRFHFGFSFRPKNILKYILLGLMGVLAFFGISKVKADTLGYSSIQVNNSNNQSVMFCNANTSKTCPANFPFGGYQELIGRTFLINFDNTTLTNNHNYTFAIEFLIVHDSSDTAFEQESFLIYQTGSSGALIDTTITWSYSTTYDWEQDYYITSYIYQGQFKATSTSSFYASLKMENNESFFGVAVGNISLTDDSMNEEIINANYQNTQNIINNQNSNTQEIKDTINDNLQSCRDSLNLLDYNSFNFTGTKYINPEFITLTNNTGSTVGGMSYIATGRLPSGTYTFINYSSSTGSIFVMFNASDYSHVVTIGNHYTFNYDGSSYLRFLTGNLNNGDSRIYKLSLVKGNMVLPYEQYGKQLCSNKIDNLNDSINNTNQSIQDLNDTISDDTIDTTSSDSFFGNFNNNTHGLTGIVTLPLTTIQGLSNSSCSPLSLTIPFISSNNNLQLPCLTPIYQSNFGTFFTLYQTILFGFVSYYVCINIFRMVKDFKDPNKDKIEVMDL